MENELDIPLASPSVLSPSNLYSLYLSLSHTHRTHLYIYIYWLQRMQRQCGHEKSNIYIYKYIFAPLIGEHCPSLFLVLVCELYAQYQVAILFLCTDQYLFSMF